jgi:hypothetical protein
MANGEEAVIGKSVYPHFNFNLLTEPSKSENPHMKSSLFPLDLLG